MAGAQARHAFTSAGRGDLTAGSFLRQHRTAPTPMLDPVTTILMHLEKPGLSRRDLEPAFGSRARVAEILNRRRTLTLAMIRRLHDQLGIPLEPLMREYAVVAA
jgi:antitoxin component HigA of HigAB toxin-antitoxin module